MKQAASYSQVVGLVLRHYRKREKYKQSDLARAVGVTASVWSRIEAGQINLHITHLDRACEEMGVWASEILDRAERLRERLDQDSQQVKIFSNAAQAQEEPGQWLLLDLRTLEKVARVTASDLLPGKEAKP